jgi:hypothetical protein
MELNPEAFSAGQLKSKIWAARELENCINTNNVGALNVYLLGGWYATLFFILKIRDNIEINTCRSFDLDPEACIVANTINNLWEQKDWQFKSFPKDVNEIDYPSEVNCVINTSAEHMESHDWFENIPAGTICLIQSNNLEIPEHVNTVKTIEGLKTMYPLSELFFEGAKTISSYKRFMIIGKK